MTKLVLDVDTGSDDAVAVMLAALHPELELTGVCTVSGNVPLANTTENTLRVLDHIGRGDIPVHAGAEQPLARVDLPKPRAEMDLSAYHDAYLDLPPSKSVPHAASAVSYLTERFRGGAGDLVLVATGPLTNVALAVKADPQFVANVSRLVIMGGGHEISNVTAAAEFNFWADPEAAQVVMRAGFTDITLVPLDATHKALLSRQDCAQLRKLGAAGAVAAALVERRIDGYDDSQPMAQPGSAPVHDALCVAHLVSEAVITCDSYHVDVETAGTLTLGRSVVDTHRRGGKAPNAKVAFDADPGAFMGVLREAFSSRERA